MPNALHPLHLNLSYSVSRLLPTNLIHYRICNSGFMIGVELFLTFDIMVAGTCGGVRVAPASSTPTVIVIGAGFGGLAAARFLHNSNLEVRVLRLDLYPVLWFDVFRLQRHSIVSLRTFSLAHWYTAFHPVTTWSKGFRLDDLVSVYIQLKGCALNACLLQVVVLESRDRIGGRVYTDYSFGFPVDMGASW